MVWRMSTCVVAFWVSVAPAYAQEGGASEAEFWSPQECLLVNDYAFEHSLRDGLAEADRVALTNVFEVATYECLGLAMEICEGQDGSITCLNHLSAWVRDQRAAIVARLPAEIEYENAFTARRYTQTLERAGAPADEAVCDHLSDAHRARYCEVVSEGEALEGAYDAWRMARREGVVDLEGHPPVDMELIQ